MVRRIRRVKTVDKMSDSELLALVETYVDRPEILSHGLGAIKELCWRMGHLLVLEKMCAERHRVGAEDGSASS